MRAKEQQDDFNMNLMQSLNIIEKKLDKESGSSKSGSHKSPNEKRRKRSVVDITITPQGIALRDHKKTQVHPL
jgi:hypothetical protein